MLTTNVDHCFQKAGFDKKRLFYTQGDLFHTFVLVFPMQNENDKHILLSYFGVPEDTLDLRVCRDHVSYDVWERKGYLQTIFDFLLQIISSMIAAPKEINSVIGKEIHMPLICIV